MFKTSNNIKLKLKKKHSNSNSLMDAILIDSKKFIYEIISDDVVIIRFNPLYRSFWIHSQNPGRFVEGRLTSQALNNINPVIEIEEYTVSNTFLIIVSLISILLIAMLIKDSDYVICLGVIGFAAMSVGIVHFINLHGLASFTGELIDEIEK